MQFWQLDLFTKRHTGAYIADEFNSILMDEWQIEKKNVHLLVRDAGSNMVTASALAKLPSLDCTAHKLQLVINDAMDSDKSIIYAIDVARRIVSHFRRSEVARGELKQLQRNLNVPQHRLTMAYMGMGSVLSHFILRLTAFFSPLFCRCFCAKGTNRTISKIPQKLRTFGAE